MTAKDKAAATVVPVSTLQRWSPLGATTAEPVRLATAPGVEAWELPFTTQLDLRLGPSADGLARALGAIGIPLPTTPNRVEKGPDLRAIWLAPDEWLIVGPAAEAAGPNAVTTAAAATTATTVAAPRARGAKRAGVERGGVSEAAIAAAVGRAGGSVVDVSAHRTIVRLSGPRAAELLAQGCSLDLHPRSFPVGTSAQTLLARVDVILERSEAEVFVVFIRASFASYLLDWLREAMGAPAARPNLGSGRRAKPSGSA